MLILEIEHLSGVSFAAAGPDRADPDWPPQPDRIFSALVATWAARGRLDAEAEALRWLEGLPPPVLHASPAHARGAPVVFVPPNDPRSDRSKHALGVLPARRSRQPRRFPAARPTSPVLHLAWPAAQPAPATLTALTALAADVASVGHSASLTRCCFRGEAAAPLPEGAPAQRWVYSGRLAELCRDFAAGRRPQAGVRVAPAPAEDAGDAAAGVFDDRWLLLEHVLGDMPDVRAAALVSRGIRAALMSGYDRRGLGEHIPEVVSGHAPDGRPSPAPHLAIVPLPFAGFPFADGHLLGFALVPPRGSGLLTDETLLAVLRDLAPVDPELGRRVLTVTTPVGTPSHRAFSVGLAPALDAARRSLDPRLYTRPARRFGTVTPIVLDRHLKARGEGRWEEMRELIAAACRRVGLPEPSQVVPDKHSAVEGMPSAWPSGAAPRWTRWRLPAFLENRQLTHAIFEFDVPVAGPVILGAGRHHGLGLCRPLAEEGEG